MASTSNFQRSTSNFQGPDALGILLRQGFGGQAADACIFLLMVSTVAP